MGWQTASLLSVSVATLEFPSFLFIRPFLVERKWSLLLLSFFPSLVPPGALCILLPSSPFPFRTEGGYRLLKQRRKGK